MAAFCAIASGHREDDRNELLKSVPKSHLEIPVYRHVRHPASAKQQVDELARNTPPYGTQRSPIDLEVCRGIVSSMSFVRDGKYDLR